VEFTVYEGKMLKGVALTSFKLGLYDAHHSFTPEAQ